MSKNPKQLPKKPHVLLGRQSSSQAPSSRRGPGGSPSDKGSTGDEFARLRAVSTATPHELVTLANDESPIVRRAVAERPDLTPDLLLLLAKDPVSSVRLGVLVGWSGQTLAGELPHRILADLAQDSSEMVREEVALLPETPAEIIRQMTFAVETSQRVLDAISRRTNSAEDRGP